MAADWTWVSSEVAISAHAHQLTQHGGAEGIRDEGMLDSAMARPLNLVGYGDPDAADLAAAYAFGIARNHPFIDGNKRTALVVSESFLRVNGYDLTCDDDEAIATFLALAAGELTPEALAEWFRRWIAPAT